MSNVKNPYSGQYPYSGQCHLSLRISVTAEIHDSDPATP